MNSLKSRCPVVTIIGKTRKKPETVTFGHEMGFMPRRSKNAQQKAL